MNYPILNQIRLQIFERELKRLYFGVETDFLKANNGSQALHAGFDHENEGPIDNQHLDDLLKGLGFKLETCEVLDERYVSKYYTFKWMRSLWVAIPKNESGCDCTQVLINWDERLDEETRDEVGL